jgi:hypothetical protein
MYRNGYSNINIFIMSKAEGTVQARVKGTTTLVKLFSKRYSSALHVQLCTQHPCFQLIRNPTPIRTRTRRVLPIWS